MYKLRDFLMMNGITLFKDGAQINRTKSSNEQIPIQSFKKEVVVYRVKLNGPVVVYIQHLYSKFKKFKKELYNEQLN